MGKGADESLMIYNADKCEVLHFGKSNQSKIHTVKGRVLGNVLVQRCVGT